MQLFIRFRDQLRRIKPELIADLEDAIAASVSSVGGIVETGRNGLNASFDENRIGFGLSIYIFLEKACNALIKAESEMFGYALVLAHDIAGTSGQKLSRSRPGTENRKKTGIWCSDEVRKTLDFYIEFNHSEKTSAAFKGYRELRNFRSFEKRREQNNRGRNNREAKVINDLAMNSGKNTLLTGPAFSCLRNALYHYCADILGDIPPLAVRFGSDGHGLICLADAYTPQIRSLIGEKAKELDSLYEMLFKERLRDEFSLYIKASGESFFHSLVTSYTAAVKAKAATGIIIIENPNQADDDTQAIISNVYSSLDDKPLVLALGNTSAGGPGNLHGMFPVILKYNSKDLPAPKRETLKDYLKNFSNGKSQKVFSGEFPGGFLEVAYIISLLGRYFPAHFFPQLFEEEGLNREMYYLALEIMTAMDMINSGYPCPCHNNFITLAEKKLGRQKEKVRYAVRNRILSWTLSGKLRPCFNLLRILHDLGVQAGDALILESIKADVLNGTWEGIEKALKGNYFKSLVGDGNAPVLAYIYKTLRALIRGEDAEINEVFRAPVPQVIPGGDKPCYGGYRVQIQLNLAAYYIGIRNTDAASEAVRNAMHINRELAENAIPAYRHFSLVNLSRQNLDDALEYISFALDQTGQIGQTGRNSQSGELFLTFYYAASINLLYGNLSGAERLALKAEEASSALGQPEWSMKSRFLRGRICFEIGRYKGALDIFESLVRREASLPLLQPPEMLQTVRAWIFRTRNFLGRSTPEDETISGIDYGLFEIEAAYYAADYERTAELAEKYLSICNNTLCNDTPAGDFLLTERPDWRSGFCQCEYLLHCGSLPWSRLARLYKTMAQSALNPSREEMAEMLDNMQRYVREDLLGESDPFDSLYFYAWYSMLRNSRYPGDINTVLSIAFKRLNRRTGRIDDNETRQAFMTLPRWNSTLYLAARELMLI